MNKFAESLIELSIKSTFDPTKLSKSTLISSASHIKTLKRNNVSLDESTLAYNTVEILDRLKDKNGKPLDSMYKRQIGMTIKRMFPDRHINLGKYNKDRSKARHANTRLSSETVVDSLQKIIDRSSVIIRQVYSLSEIDDLALYDTCLSVLLSISTSLRINELHQLRLVHLPRIQNSEPVDIVSKSNRNSRVIMPNNMLLSVFEAIITQRPKVRQTIVLKRLEFASQFHIRRYNQGYVLINSIDYLRKKLKELSASLLIQNQTLGFNLFRKYITSELVEGGGHLVAQSMNNHSSLNTTLTHYNVVGPQAVQKTYNDLVGKLDSVAKAPTTSVDAIRAQLASEVLRDNAIDEDGTQKKSTKVSDATTSNAIVNTTNNTIDAATTNVQTLRQQIDLLNHELDEKNKRLESIEDIYTGNRQQFEDFIQELDVEMDEVLDQTRSLPEFNTNQRPTQLPPSFNLGLAADNSILTPENTRFSFQLGKPTSYL